MKIQDGLKITGVVRGWLRDAKTGKLKAYFEHRNLVVDSGKSAIAARLAGDVAVANRGEITYGAVGTGGSTPAAGDTTLETELFRKVLALRQFSGNVATFRLFLNTSEGNGTLLEFGLFGEDASGTADSGTLFNRVNINKVKTVAETLTIEAQITVG